LVIAAKIRDRTDKAIAAMLDLLAFKAVRLWAKETARAGLGYRTKTRRYAHSHNPDVKAAIGWLSIEREKLWEPWKFVVIVHWECG